MRTRIRRTAAIAAGTVLAAAAVVVAGSPVGAHGGSGGTPGITTPLVDVAADGSCPDGGTAASGYCYYAPWKWHLDRLPVRWTIYPNAPGVTGEEAAVRAAFDTWENDSASAVDFVYGGTTTSASTCGDGNNGVSWRLFPDTNGAEPDPVAWMQPCSADAMGQREFDIEFNTHYQWAVGSVAGKYDIQSIAVHEVGHAIGFAHVRDCNQVMGIKVIDGKRYNCFANMSDLRRTLGNGDLNGVRAMYPAYWRSAWAARGRPAVGIQGDPDVASWGEGRLDVFVRGGDDRIYQLTHEPTTGWAPTWRDLGAPTAVPAGSVVPIAETRATSSPAAVSWGPGRIDLVVKGPDNHVWHNAYTNGSWTGWIDDRGGILGGGPDIASWGQNHLIIVGAAPSGAMYDMVYDASLGGWQPWHALSGVTTHDPTAVSWESGRVDVFVRGSNGQMYQRYFVNNAWSPGWASRGAEVIHSAPDVASWGAGRLDIFAKATSGDGPVKHYDYQHPSWGTWAVNTQGTLASGPGAVSWPDGPNRIDVFAVSPTNQLYQLTYSR